MVESCVVVPALNAATTVGAVLADLGRTLGLPMIVVDDGSTDGTCEIASAAGARVVRHARNLGKGAAIRSGLEDAARQGFAAALTVDADGQHPAASARAVLEAEGAPGALVLGVRNLSRDGAPRSNRFGNGVSNGFLSFFARRTLRDTQCGLRRYPVRETICLRTRSRGFAFEAEVVLRAVASGLPLVEVPIDVIYPPPELRRSHFHKVRDPMRIVGTVARTVLELQLQSLRR